MKSLGLIAILMLGLCAATACARGPDSQAESERALLALHEASLAAHRDSDAGAFLAPWADEILLIDRGSMERVKAADASAVYANYLGSTTFEYYRDRKPAVATVSNDGTLGWVAAEVEAKGVHMGAEGETSVEFVSAWVSLYKKIGGEWRLVGNASNFAE